ncbi:MarR family transcriptional regulator [Asanoa sp. NPDC049573]|uniref:MarR family winged helix-turn-helix transcriptional regulator n=1 Tax=Asanoa sp. NPDC049573 TaxID=3155396 RepID=UPI0034231A4D
MQVEVVDALMIVSRAMVAVAARSLAGHGTDITLPQFRALMVLATRGPQRAADIAAELGVNASTGTRMADRLVAKGLIRRSRATTDRRAIRLALTPAGTALVQEVTDRRRAELAAIVAAVPHDDYPMLIRALRTLATAGGESSDPWWLGWAGHRPAAQASHQPEPALSTGEQDGRLA